MLLIGVVVNFPVQVFAADTYRLEQWIAPLECTENEIVDGVNTTTYLTPQECEDLLSPKPSPNPNPGDPGAPNTGYAESVWIGMLIAITFAMLALLRVTRKYTR